MISNVDVINNSTNYNKLVIETPVTSWPPAQILKSFLPKF